MEQKKRIQRCNQENIGEITNFQNERRCSVPGKTLEEGSTMRRNLAKFSDLKYKSLWPSRQKVEVGEGRRVYIHRLRTGLNCYSIFKKIGSICSN